MKRALALLSTAVLVTTLAGAVRAADPAARDKAARAFDEGKTEYKAGNYDAAATHFEKADEVLPSAQALRMALRARDQAGQRAAAATLAAQGLSRYPGDAQTREIAEPTLAKHADDLQRFEVSCDDPCVVEVGTHVVPGLPRDRWVVYVEPGEVTLRASFAGGAGSEEQVVNARAGGDNALHFLKRIDKPAAVPVPVKSTTPPPERDEPSWIEHPAVFAVLAVGTAALGGTTIWSGVDTLQNPGADTVREECRGQGEDCPEYQEGRNKQLRTNILIGATAGMAAVTLLFGVLVTEWGGGDDAPEAAVVPLPGGGFVELGGRF